MGTLACAIDDPILAARITESTSQIGDMEIVMMGSDPWVGSRLVSVRQVDALCLTPMEPLRLIEIRRALMASQQQEQRIRTALMMHEADGALIYYALGFGFDDVIVLSDDDDGLGMQLSTFLEGRDRACAAFLLPEVDVPSAVIRGVIDCADELDRKIVRLVSVGYTDREISEILHFSYQSTRNRISQLMFRSGLRNRTQLSARHCFESYWLENLF